MHACTTYVCLIPVEIRRGLQMIASQHVGAGNRTWALGKQGQCSESLSPSLVLHEIRCAVQVIIQTPDAED